MYSAITLVLLCLVPSMQDHFLFSGGEWGRDVGEERIQVEGNDRGATDRNSLK